MTVKDAVARMLVQVTADQLDTLTSSLPPDNINAIKRFCGWFDYLSDNPSWLYDSLVAYGACGGNLADLLDDIAFDKRVEERTAVLDRREMLRS